MPIDSLVPGVVAELSSSGQDVDNEVSVPPLVLLLLPEPFACVKSVLISVEVCVGLHLFFESAGSDLAGAAVIESVGKAYVAPDIQVGLTIAHADDVLGPGSLAAVSSAMPLPEAVTLRALLCAPRRELLVSEDVGLSMSLRWRRAVGRDRPTLVDGRSCPLDAVELAGR